MTAAAAAVAIVHEYTHAKQDPKMSLEDREIGAFKEQVEFLIKNPKLLEALPRQTRGFYKDFIRSEGGKDVPNVDKIKQHWKQVYNKFRVIGDEDTVPRDTLEMVRTPEKDYDRGPKDKRVKLTKWAPDKK
jgi:hypothetical protein